MQQLALAGLALADATRLEDFWPGPNVAAFAAIERLAAGANEPLVFLHGAAGSGKTHLLKAAWRAARERGTRTGYLPLDQASMLDPELIEGWGELDFVALDAVEKIAGFTVWEHALFRISEELRERGATLLVAGRKPPDALGLELADLASRLAWGPVYALEVLDDPELAALAMHIADARGLALPEPVADWLVRRLARDPASIAKTVARLDEAALAAQRRLTIPFVRATLLDR